MIFHRSNIAPTACPLCARYKIPSYSDERIGELCDCPSSTECADCIHDIKIRVSGKMPFGYKYCCLVHGEVRQIMLLSLSNILHAQTRRHITWHAINNNVLFVCSDSLRPSQQFLRHQAFLG